MKHRLLFLLLTLPTLLLAQNIRLDDPAEYRPFAHIDAGVTLGTTGIGFDLATPVHPYLDLRLGFTFIPPMGFHHEYDMLWVGREQAPTQEETERMEKMCGWLQELTSTKVDRFVDVEHRLYSYNAKLLLDVYPLQHRNFHVTVGFFVGSSDIGYATTTPKEGATMVGIRMYNDLYDQCQHLDEWEFPTITIGGHSIELDPIVGQEVKDRLNAYGPMLMPMGRFTHDITDAEGNIRFHEGDTHYITPNEEGVIRLQVKTNVFKPYLGAGYNAYLGRDGRWNIGADLGVMFIGGKPHIYGDDGVCLTHDVTAIGGKPGQYVRLVSAFPVWPVLEFKTSYRLK